MKTPLTLPPKLAPVGDPCRFHRRRRIICAMLALVLLPCVAFGAGVKALQANAVIPGQEAVDFLSDKSMSYWFLALAAIAIASWTYVFKWLIGQLESQRADHAKTLEKLIAVLEANAIRVDNRSRDSE